MPKKTNFLSRQRGPEYCELCGEKIRWKKLITDMWIAVNETPVLYIPGEGKNWLVENAPNGSAVILKDCQIYKPGKGMDTTKVKYGLEPHVWTCPGGNE